jgi:hypothetical protein
MKKHLRTQSRRCISKCYSSRKLGLRGVLFRSSFNSVISCCIFCICLVLIPGLLPGLVKLSKFIQFFPQFVAGLFFFRHVMHQNLHFPAKQKNSSHVKFTICTSDFIWSTSSTTLLYFCISRILESRVRVTF